MVAVKTDHLTLGYEGRNSATAVLSDVTFEAFAGDFIGVAGINGSGKSTLLRAIAGLLTPRSGSIYLGKHNASQLSVTERAREVAIVLTGKISGFNVTVIDAVTNGLMPYTDAFHRITPAQLTFIQGVLEKAGLAEYSHRPLSELSDGLYQKTMIARALAQQTPLLLLDEPLAFLDYGSKHEFLRLLAGLCEKQRKCVMLSTHDLDLLKRYCNKTMLVSEGRAQLFATNEAALQPEFLRMGGGYL